MTTLVLCLWFQVADCYLEAYEVNFLFCFLMIDGPAVGEIICAVVALNQTLTMYNSDVKLGLYFCLESLCFFESSCGTR